MASAPFRIGLYGGTFDPIHLGHLILARHAAEQLGLSQIVFIPAAISPHKLSRAPAAPADVRWAMVQAAIVGEPQFAADDCELHRSGPSYAFDTVTSFRRQMPGAGIAYLIGEDNVRELPTWHRIAELREIVQFAVFRRRLAGPPPPPGAGPFPIIDRAIDISSTDIRMRVAAGLSIRYLVTDPVAHLIDAHQLYRPPEGLTPSPPKN